LTTDGDHDSEQSDRVLCIDGRPRGRLLFHAKRFVRSTHRSLPFFLSLRAQLAPKEASSLELPAGMFIPCSALYRGNGVRGEKKQWANKLESTNLVIHFGRR